MTKKKVPIGRRPTKEVDAWVDSRGEQSKEEEESANQAEKMKRLTIDIPQSLHRSIKSYAVEQGTTMADLLRDFLEREYGNH